MIAALLGLVAVTAMLAADSPCISIERDRILTEDFIAGAPEMAAAPPGIPLAYAPMPGARRIFSGQEIKRIAGRFQISLSAPVEMCFTYAVEDLTAEALIAAMRQSLATPHADIEIVDFIRLPVPRGILEFPRTMLSAPPAGVQKPALWRGYMRYGANRRFSVWARVNLQVPIMRAIAVRELRRGVPVEAHEFRMEESVGFPDGRIKALSPDQIVGRIPRSTISAGATILPGILESPPDVSRGDAVEVVVRQGSAVLSLLGIAETGGRIGEIISVRNLESRRTFPARITGKGKAAAGREQVRHASGASG